MGITIKSFFTRQMSNKILSSWSGGKDSCYALILAKQMGMQPTVLLNMMNENGKVSRSHAIPKYILQLQANAIQLPVVTVPASWAEYEMKYIETLQQIVAEYKIDAAVFGDIDLQPHRDWEEKVCAAANIKAILPLWQQDRKQLVLQMLQHGIKAFIVSCNEVMGESFLGRLINEDLISEMEAIGVDVCGENGEYHTLVVNCPLFKEEIKIKFGNKNHHGKYWFIEMN
jgi:diphthine-ammonia ligase